jgi:hypothetical protein
MEQPAGSPIPLVHRCGRPLDRLRLSWDGPGRLAFVYVGRQTATPRRTRHRDTGTYRLVSAGHLPPGAEVHAWRCRRCAVWTSLDGDELRAATVAALRAGRRSVVV